MDDDLDIIMLRPEYDRFLALVPNELDSTAYYLQREFSEHWPMFFTKLRKNGTACIERYIPRDPLTHQGYTLTYSLATTFPMSRRNGDASFWHPKR